MVAITESGQPNRVCKNKLNNSCHPPISAQTSCLYVSLSFACLLSYWKKSSTVLTSGTFCSDGNSLYLCCPIWQPHVLLRTWNVAGVTEELDFSFYLI